MITTVAAIISIALGIGATVYSEVMNNLNAPIRSQINKLAGELSEIISKNTNLKSQLYDALQSNNNTLMTQLMNGIGFGPRVNAIQNQITKNKQEYQKRANDIDTKSNAAQKEIDNLNTQITNTYNNTITGHNEASKAVTQAANALANGGLNAK